MKIVPPRFAKMLSNARHLGAVRKPEVWRKYLTKLLRAKLTGRISPRQIDIALTFQCNLACDHCFSAPLFHKNEKEMSYDVLRSVAKDCKELGIPVVHFTGGEILMRQDLETVIQIFKPDENIIYLQSNGTLASWERLTSLKKAGLDFFSVSLESPDSGTQDLFRHHDGYFDNALACLARARKAGLLTSVNLTLDKGLLYSPDLSKLIEKLGRMGHIVYGNLPVPVGRYRGREDILWLGNERVELTRLTRKYPHFRIEFDSNFGSYGCPAMKEKIYLCAYGDIIPCPYIHVAFGNVKNESLVDIHKRCLEFDIFREYPDHCLASENVTFINEIMNYTHTFDRHPVSHEHFIHKLKNTDFSRRKNG